MLLAVRASYTGSNPIGSTNLLVNKYSLQIRELIDYFALMMGIIQNQSMVYHKYQVDPL